MEVGHMTIYTKDQLHAKDEASKLLGLLPENVHTTGGSLMKDQLPVAQSGSLNKELPSKLLGQLPEANDSKVGHMPKITNDSQVGHVAKDTKDSQRCLD